MPAHLRPELGFLTVRPRTLAVASLTMSASLLYLGALPATAAAAEVERFERGSQDFQVAAWVDEAPAERDGFGITEFTPVQWPLAKNTKISSHFGYRSAPCGACSSDHQGVDWVPGAGKAIAAVAPGKVVEVGNPSGALGVYAIVEHVVDGDRFRSVYAHMQHGSLTVAVGDQVKLGERLGKVGNSGTSTGAHLHFGILDEHNKAIDPLKWLEKHATE